MEAANAKIAPAKLVEKAGIKARGPKKIATASDYEGFYKWDYEQSSKISADTSSLTGTASSSFVTITTAEDDTLTLSGMGPLEDLTAYVDEDGYLVIPSDQFCYYDSDYGKCNLVGIFYYEGDDDYEAGWYGADIYAILGDDGVIYFDEDIFFYIEIAEGEYEGYRMGSFYLPGSTMTPSEPPTLVELPEGAEVVEYAVGYIDDDEDAEYGYLNVAIVGQEVYVQGLNSYVPESWVKGTLSDDGTVTFAGGQYLGNYAGYDFFLQEEDATLSYDATIGSFSTEGVVSVVMDGDTYDYYKGLVLVKTVDNAGMPRDPEIYGILESSYGPVMHFTVPTIDTDGKGMDSSKLFYRFYIDIDKEVSELTLTPALYKYLEEDLTIIPVKFTEDYDIYTNRIYMNMDMSTWNKIGIQVIYAGGGEENSTEIQWYTIKEYAEGYTFDFNAMDVATSSNDSDAGNITSDLTLEGKNVNLTISPAISEGSTPTRFWGTNSVPQLRCYDNTLTFTAEEGYVITKIVFNYNPSYWGGKLNAGDVTADSGEITDDKMGAATWEGEAESVVFTIGANTQLNSIMVVVKEKEAPAPEPIVLPDGIEMEEWFVDGIVRINSTEELEGTVNVGFADGYVYIQGLVSYLPEAVIRGELSEDGTTVTIPALQYLGNYADALDMFISAYGEKDPEDIVLTYDAENKKFTTEQFFIVTDQTYEHIYIIYGYVEIYKEKQETPEPIVVPDGIKMEEWFVKAIANDTQELNGTVNLGFDDGYMYIQGLVTYLPDACVRGELSEDGTTVTIPALQYVGNYGGSYDLFISAVDGKDPQNIVFTYDEENQKYTSDQVILITDQAYSTNYLQLTNVVIYKEDATAIAGVSAADGSAVFFDMSGRKADANAKGMLIMQTRMNDGTVKTSKVFRK